MTASCPTTSMMRLREPTRWLVTCLTILFVAVASVASGCGGSECRSDHDCSGDEVCEPEGCLEPCTKDEDCPATHRCVERQVEEGKVCVRQ